MIKRKRKQRLFADKSYAWYYFLGMLALFAIFPIWLFPGLRYVIIALRVAAIAYYVWQIDGFLGKYYLAEDGIHVRYLLGIRETVYSWENMGRLDLCWVSNHKLGKVGADLVIRYCTKDCPEELQKNDIAYQLARVHRRKIALILATRDRWEEIQKACPVAVTQEKPYDEMQILEGFGNGALSTLLHPGFTTFLCILFVLAALFGRNLYMLYIMIPLSLYEYIFGVLRDDFVRYRLTEHGAQTLWCRKHYRRSFAWDEIQQALQLSNVKMGYGRGIDHPGSNKITYVKASYIVLVRKNPSDFGPRRHWQDDEYNEYSEYRLNENYILLPVKLKNIEFIEQYIPITKESERKDVGRR